jgi:hypothetical protein
LSVTPFSCLHSPEEIQSEYLQVSFWNDRCKAELV